MEKIKVGNNIAKSKILICGNITTEGSYIANKIFGEQIVKIECEKVVSNGLEKYKGMHINNKCRYHS